MAYEIVIKKRFTNKVLGVIDYLEKEWGKKVAQVFLDKVRTRINAIQSHVKNVRSTLITKHNRLYYRVVENKIYILNLYDTRRKKRRKFGS